MKNRFLFVFMLLFTILGTAVAQPAKYWTLSGHPGAWDPLNMTATMIVNVDGEEMANANLEMAAFIGDELMSDGTFPLVGSSGRYLYYMTLNGYDPSKPNAIVGGNKLTFRLYDHEAGTVLDYYSPTEVVYSTNWNLGSAAHPIAVNFFVNEPKWEQVTDASALAAGDVILVTNTATDYALGEEQLANNRESYPVTLAGGTITWADPEPYEVQVYDPDEDEYYTEWVTPMPPQKILLCSNGAYPGLLSMFVGDGFLYAGASNRNYLYTGADIDDNYFWDFSFETSGEANVVAQGPNTRNTLRYAANNQKFSCYAAGGQSPIYVYKMVPGGGEPEPEYYAIDVTIQPENAGTVTLTPDQEQYLAGSEVMIEAYPAEGYQFMGFEVSGLDGLWAAPFTLTVNADVQITAVFELATYNITMYDVENGYATASASEATYGTEITIEVFPNAGFSLVDLVGYTDEGTFDIDMESLSFTMPASDVTIVPAFAPISYTITIGEMENGTVTASTYTSYAGEEITLTVTPADGYQLATLTYTYGETTEAIDPETLTFTMPVADVTVNATFELLPPTMYEVTVNVVPADVATVAGAGNYEEGTLLTEEMLAISEVAAGYEFVNFTVNGEPIELPYEVTGDVAIDANFQLQSFQVTVVANPSYVANVTGTGTYNYGEEILPTYELYNPGYMFVNWTVGGEPIELPYVVTEAVEIVANFQQLTYTVEVVVAPEEAGTAALVEEGPFVLGDAINLTYTENVGYEFVNFTVNGEPIELPYTVLGNTVIVANFQLKSFEVTVVANPSYVANVTGTGTYNYGEEITPEYELYNPGYEFVNWTVGGEPIELPYVVTEAVEIVANFQQLTYTVEVVVDPEEAGTAALVEEGPFVLGDAINLTYTENVGYEFVNFTVNGEPIELPYTVLGNTVIVANFDLIYYEISVEPVPAEGGEADIVGDDTFYGAELTLTATPNEGWNFVNWTLNDEVVSEEAEYNITVTGNADYVANFEMINYNIVVEAGEGGEATITDGPYHYEDLVTVTAIPNDGYNFINWTVNGIEISSELIFNFLVLEDMTIVANFAEALIPVYAISVVADPVEGGTVTGGANYLEGAEVTLTATAALGYLFENWTLEGEVVSEEATYTFTAAAEGEYVAHFTQEEYTVTIEATEGGTAEITNAAEVYHYGDVLTLAYEAAEGYRFVNFTVNGEEITSPYTVTGDAAIVANFELIPVIPEYTVTVVVNPADAGTVEGAGTYEEGTEITLVATANDGYEFVNFTIGEEVVEMPYTVTADVEIVANFEVVVVPPTEYTVTVVVNPAEAGTVEGAGTYEEGTEITLVATANEGYEFVNFTIGEEVVEMPYVVTADVEIVANFEVVVVPPTEYTVTVVVNPADAGTVEGAGTYEEGTEITLVATANEGYEFVNFTIGEEVVEMPYTVTADVEIVANFNEIPVVPVYNITVEEIEHGVISAPATAAAEEVVTVTTTAETMYSLVALYYTIDGTNEIVDIDLATKQFVMPAADITIGGAFELMEGHGDVNLDGYINVVDIIAVFNYILEKDPVPFDFGQADMNEDGVIDVSDAMAINALILGLKAECGDTQVTYEIKDNQLFIESEVALAGYQFRLSAEPAAVNMDGFSTMGNWSNGEYILIVYNLHGEKEAGIYSVLDLGDATLNSIVMSTKEGCQVRGNAGVVSVASFDERNYSVYPVPANTEVTVAGPEITTIDVYNMMGQKVMTVNANSDETVVNVSSLTAGNYLFRINTANGATTKNVVVVR